MKPFYNSAPNSNRNDTNEGDSGNDNKNNNKNIVNNDLSRQRTFLLADDDSLRRSNVPSMSPFGGMPRAGSAASWYDEDGGGKRSIDHNALVGSRTQAASWVEAPSMRSVGLKFMGADVGPMAGGGPFLPAASPGYSKSMGAKVEPHPPPLLLSKSTAKNYGHVTYDGYGSANPYLFDSAPKLWHSSYYSDGSVEPNLYDPAPLSRWVNPKPAKLPRFHSADLNLLELSLSELLNVTKSCKSYFKNNSMQATYEDDPASAEVSTIDGVKFRLKFWQSATDPEHCFFVDIQLRQGDGMRYGRIVRELLDIAKGIHGGSKDEADHDAMDFTVMPVELEMEQIKKFQAVVQDMIPPEAIKETEASSTESVLRMVHECLTSRSFEARATGLEVFVHFSDFRKTLVSAALDGALVVLQGKGPSTKTQEQNTLLDKMCAEIQQVFFTVLSRGYFDGDEELRMLLQSSPKLSEDARSSNKRKKEGPYEAAITASTNKILTILVNALESFSCASLYSKNEKQEILSEFFFHYEDVTNTDLYPTLLELIANCRTEMAISTLACKAMRLLLQHLPPLKERFQGNSHAKVCIETAYQTGRSCHALLEAESKRLLENIQA